MTDVCDHCCGWVSDHRGVLPAEVERDYPSMMAYVLLCEFGIGEEAARGFTTDACTGNWERLHLTEPERHIDSAGWAEMLLDEVFYFSDRWSWDRVLRAQWLYKMLRWRLCLERSDDGQGH